MKTLKETIKDMKELGLVIERVIYKGDVSDLKDGLDIYKIQFKKEDKDQTFKDGRQCGTTKTMIGEYLIKKEVKEQ